MKENINIAIFGGSFDPPHLGHCEIIKEALKSLDIDKLFIIPAFLNPFKKNFFAPPELRLKWLKKLYEDNEKIQICQYEINNSKPTPTYESVEHLHVNYNIKKCYLIIGADNLEKLTSWYNYELLKQKVEFVVASRDELHVGKDLKKLQINVNISSTVLRNRVQEEFIPKEIFTSVKDFYEGKYMQKTLQTIRDLLDSKKAEDIQVFDMSEKDYFTDYVIIATTLNERHSASLIDDLKPVLKELNEQCLHAESSGEWAVLDLGNILIHLMSDNYRAKYDIESFLNDFEKNKTQEIIAE